jgi:nucleoside phosphorylase
MDQSTYNIFIFIALECEARPLLKFFNLKKQHSHPFSIFINDNLVLTITGIGKNAMAGGVAYTLALFSQTHQPILINLGIAGHINQPIGSLFLANKIVDTDSGKIFYPQLLGNDWPNTCTINTLSTPSNLYSDNCLNDMEASAFYEIAVKFSSCELIHCIKIVSDNQQSSINQINAREVTTWIENQIAIINIVFKKLTRLHQLIASVNLENYNEILNMWHFTATGKIKLKSLLIRWKALSATDWFISDVNNFCTGKELLKKLEADVDQKEVHL